jgi:hypothetical protein
MPTIFAIDGAEFADFGAVSQGVTELQTALKALGQGVGDNILRAIVVDGLIGPKTTAATNRAMTVHVGSGQAAASLRTGALSQATVAAQASALAQIIETEAQRRGYNVPTAKVIATVAKASAPKPAITPAPAAYVPTSAVSTAARAPQVLPAASDDSTAMIIKYGAIGLGLVIATAGIYYVMKRKGGNLRGLGAGGFYHTDAHEFQKGQRVQLHPGTDLWARGDRYGTVTKIMKRSVHVKTDHGNKTSVSPSRLEIID